MLAVVVVLGIASFRALDRATPVYYYRVVDQQTLVVGTDTGAPSWTRVTGVDETQSMVTISVNSMPSAAGYGFEILVKLSQPLGSRIVVDGSTGETVQFTRCLPPGYGRPGCR